MKNTGPTCLYIHSHPRKVAKSCAHTIHVYYPCILYVHTCRGTKRIHPHRIAVAVVAIHTFTIRSNSENTYPLCCYKIFRASLIICMRLRASLLSCVDATLLYALFVRFVRIRSFIRSFLLNLSYIFVWLVRFKCSPI